MKNSYNKNIEKYFLTLDASVKQAIRKMKKIGEKVLFVIDDKNTLIGAISDGDIRKWILSDQSLNDPVDRICNKNPKYVHEDYELKTVKNLMLDLRIESVPVLNFENVIIDVLVWDKVFRDGIVKPKKKISIPVVIMAGGKGIRLDPFTRILPKPLIPIGERTILEIIMDSFYEYQVSAFYLSVYHKANLIKAYLEEMTDRYNIQYIEEDKPLGTAGSLKFLLKTPHKQFFVTNCDIIIETDHAEIVAHHDENRYDLTLVVSHMNYQIPYGVCTILNGGVLKNITEKPTYDFLVNTGMYIIGRKVLDLIPDDLNCDIPELIKTAQKKGLRVGVFPVDDKSWIDIGQWKEYHAAIEKMNLL
ncbi:conserved hypothetical protein [Candidatus Desulfarcum epimagneticum]|uniref:CBS domain-containing protein n=1 Tax=uncultured Desulfobacteraceae bacterium TaxID=218296 RepID=A0A484HIB7_9BACT|nr:conserved hypothetical protein [uncultured Desulfobacteraceae bacterium]